MGCPKSVPVVDSHGTTLPKAPTWWKEVDDRKPKPGTDARSALAQTRVKLKSANSVIRNSKAWYLTVRKGAAGDK